MKNMKLAIVGLLAVAAIASNAMNNEATPNHSIRRVSNPFYMDLHYAISSGQTAAFMEALNNMEAQGHALEGEDYDNLMDYAKQKGFRHISIMEDTTYQKCTAAVLNDDTFSFMEHIAYGEYLEDGHIYWLLDLAAQVNAPQVKLILQDEYRRRGNPSPVAF